jgi:hypothetical protein
MDMPTTNNDFTNTTQPALNLVDLNKDVLTLICEHLQMRDACNLYRTGSKILREAIAETEFDFFSTYESTIPLGVSVKQFRNVFVNAIGISLVPHGLTKEDFYYMVPRLCKNNPKGLQKVKIDLSYPYRDDENIIFKKYKRNAFNNLKGIHSLNISGNKHVKYRHLKTQTDIKCLIMKRCNHIHESILQYFTKVKYLEITHYSQMTYNALTFIKSKHLETLKIITCDRVDQPPIEKFLEEYPIKILFESEDYGFNFDDYDLDYEADMKYEEWWNRRDER